MKVEKDAVLTCSYCGVEGPHKLLYLSQHLSASRCANCEATQIFSDHLYADYTMDLAKRAGRLPLVVAKDAVRRSIGVLNLPVKAVRKPFGLLREVALVTAFERGRRKAPNVGRRA